MSRDSVMLEPPRSIRALFCSPPQPAISSMIDLVMSPVPIKLCSLAVNLREKALPFRINERNPRQFHHHVLRLLDSQAPATLELFHPRA